MRKIILMASFLLAFAGLNFAQTTPKPKKPKTTKTAAAPATVSATAPVAAKTTTTTAPKTTTAAAGPTKKDGTPDMRYKANKEAAKPPVHLKKDGTPDKRFKENKPQKTI